jgi:hypothetical protein
MSAHKILWNIPESSTAFKFHTPAFSVSNPIFAPYINPLQLKNLHSPTLSASVIVLFIVMLSSACKKEPVFSYPAKYYGDRITVKTNARLFTSTGEIKDKTKINAFIRDLSGFNLENREFAKGDLALTLLSPDSAKLEGRPKNFHILKSGNQFLFRSEFNIQGANPKSEDFKDHLLKYTEVTPVPAIFGPNPLAREFIVAYGNAKQMSCPQLAYRMVSRNRGGYNSRSGVAYNEFNEAALTKMIEGDTLAIKTYEMILRAN